MATDYTINWSNDTLKTPIIVPANIIDTSTSLVLYGQNRTNYGEGLQENLIRLMENFTSDTQPINPTLGQIWYDTNFNVLKVFNGTEFRNQKLSSDILLNPELGDIVINSGTQRVQYYDGTIWQDVASLSDVLLISSNLVTHEANQDIHITPDQNTLLDGILTSISSGEINFLDGVTSNIQVQLDNLSTSITNGLADVYTKTEADARYLGISAKAADSNLLDGLDSTQFLRSDVSDTMNGTLTANEVIVGTVTLSDRAPINSPIFTGIPESVTPPIGDNSTRIATTAYVKSEIANTPPPIPTLYNIGDIIFAQYDDGSGIGKNVTSGTIVLGSELKLVSIGTYKAAISDPYTIVYDKNSTIVLTGSWRNEGNGSFYSGGVGTDTATVWVRIA